MGVARRYREIQMNGLALLWYILRCAAADGLSVYSTTMESDTSLISIPPEMLSGVVRRALDHQHAIVRTWQASPISYRSMIATSAGLYRVSGTATDGAEQLSWSVILKIVRIAGPQTRTITAFDYWKREPLAYASGIIDHLSGGLTAPRCWGVFDISETSVWLWLEDVGDTYRRRWPLSRYGIAAHHFGVFNGSGRLPTR